MEQCCFIWYCFKIALENIQKSGILAMAVKSIITTFFSFNVFEVFPHQPVGVSEVHLILGSTLF